MRNALLAAMVSTVLVGLLHPPVRAGEGAERSWSAGFAEADITPRPEQCMMVGFGRERYCRGTLAPLLTQVVVLRDAAGHTGVLITADLLEFERVMVDVIRYAITQKHGIPAKGVIFSASHTHWGPAVKFHTPLALGAPNVWYLAQLEETILGKVDQAVQNLSPATIEYGWIDYRSVGCNRRRPLEGKITWGPYPEGSFDGHTPIMCIKRGSSPRQLLVVGHACHPTSSGRIEKWSPDYPGAMRDVLASRLPDTKAVFVQGCGADAKVVHKDPDTGRMVFSSDPSRSKEAGTKLAEAVMAHLERGEMIPLDGPLACSLVTGQLSYGRRWSPEEIEQQAYSGPRRSFTTWKARQLLALPDHSQGFRYDVQVWKLGNHLTVFAMEGEVCSPWGTVLRSLARTEEAMVIGYANSTTTYIPDSRIVREGGYEGFGFQQYFLPGPFTENIDAEIKDIVSRAMDALK